jgi:hypothetical protein
MLLPVNYLLKSCTGLDYGPNSPIFLYTPQLDIMHITTLFERVMIVEPLIH